MRVSLLVVGDESETVVTIGRYFLDLGYHVETALNDGDAAMLATLHRPDAAILVLGRPDTSGPDLMTALHEVDPSIAVIVLGDANDLQAARTMLEASLSMTMN
jgi:DNA-binding response OmpR family regulator